ncbi:MAG: hypothetical protein OT477_16040 [Chloroflexi bacterium]|nr:hypothetical protein [Chloroflexota bacterium]
MANNSLNRLPFFSALLANGKATVVFTGNNLAIVAGGKSANGRYFSLADAAHTGERMARELAQASLIDWEERCLLAVQAGLAEESREEQLDRIVRKTAEALGLFTPQQEVLPELHQMAEEIREELDDVEKAVVHLWGGRTGTGDYWGAV